jgi:DNA repair photolyase
MQKCRVDVRRVVREKLRLAEKVRSMLSDDEAREAERDWHAKRAPIPCGMTIHTGSGCSYGCAYCYIYDMGFTSRPKPYPLSGLQLVYALLVNPYFVPGPNGTLLAFGSVTEPFMPETRDRAFEYLRATRDYLGNPQQISTKTALRGSDIERFLASADPRIDVLVSMTTIRWWRRLEPGASSPEERFEFMRELSSRGVHVTLFLRPIIPGVTDRELEDIISRAAEAGVKAVVPGTLRITERIVRRLRATGVVDMGELESRIVRRPRRPGEQVPIRGADLKRKAERIAEEYGLKVLPSSCSANIDSHLQACAACSMGPCGDTSLLPDVDESELYWLLEELGLRPLRVKVARDKVVAEVRGPRGRVRVAEHWIIGLTRRRPVIRAL